jgi:predicted AAA+ superfamily ATPase
MAITNKERIGKTLDLLKEGLLPYLERKFRNKYGKNPINEINRYMQDDRLYLNKALKDWDIAGLLKLMWESWNEVFRDELGPAERGFIGELRGVRNSYHHDEPFSSNDTRRALDTARRILKAISAPQVEEIEKMDVELSRVIFAEQLRNEQRKHSSSLFESQAAGSLKPWRSIIKPHQDVAKGSYQQAEFAADLWQVHLGEGADEYLKPVEFFRRTFLTESLKKLLISAILRVTGRGGDPVVQLQTNFGGGKTHSMLAIYHLFSGTPPTDLPGIEAIMQEAGVEKLPVVKRVVLVGNRISPGNPARKEDGTIINTLWGELAWQLGGREAFETIRADDEKATNPGDRLREIFLQYGPCVILIDEWVAYARQLYDQNGIRLPGGNFETQFTFAQTLTESVKLAKNCLLVISLPASETTGSPHTQADDAEVGGQRGREALERLQNVIGRVESTWKPASAEEGFEIVRRRLFEPLTEQSQFIARDAVARAFHDLYNSQQEEFPNESRNTDYENRIKAAYPIHPEVFDRLYSDWSTLVKFQRTRGVLRLMAAVIHNLWENGDPNPLIMPCSIPISDPYVQFELTRYLSDNWTPVIEKDVDGPNSLPLKMDNEIPNLGRISACRRVARTIYLGSAPTATAAHRGIEDRRIKLGCVMPGESAAIFGDAMRRLSSSATYLYSDGPRYWYSTQPTLTKMAADIAEDLKRKPEKVAAEVEKRVRLDVRSTGDFNRVHPFPQTSQDVPDDTDARLVILGVDTPYVRDAENKAVAAAKNILETRGSSQRYYRNTLVFLAVDKTRLQDLDEAVRHYLAWESIIKDKERLDLTANQVRDAETHQNTADSTVKARLPEAYQWLLVPVQPDPKGALEWKAYRLTGQDSLAERASKKMRNEELLLTRLAGTSLRLEMDKVPLWRGDHVEVKQLAEDFAQYCYLPRLKDPSVLLAAIQNGVSSLVWRQDTFAYADSYDENAGRYRGLCCGQQMNPLNDNLTGLVVKPEIAEKQILAETAPKPGPNEALSEEETGDVSRITIPAPVDEITEPEKPVAPKRYYGTVRLDPTRAGRDASRIAEEVIAHLVSLVGADVKVTLEIEANVPSGVPDNVVRTVTENGRTLKFINQGFEKE